MARGLCIPLEASLQCPEGPCGFCGMRATLNVRTADAGCLTMVRSHAMAKQGQHKRDAND